MRGAIPPLFNASSWRDAQLKESEVIILHFYMTLTLIFTYCRYKTDVAVLIMFQVSHCTESEMIFIYLFI
jgi:hypothetical protein